MTKYRAEIKPLNADKISTSAHGTSEVPTMAQDVNGAGFIDLEENFPVLGTTMVPFDDQPDALNI